MKVRASGPTGPMACCTSVALPDSLRQMGRLRPVRLRSLPIARTGPAHVLRFKSDRCGVDGLTQGVQGLAVRDEPLLEKAQLGPVKRASRGNHIRLQRDE